MGGDSRIRTGESTMPSGSPSSWIAAWTGWQTDSGWTDPLASERCGSWPEALAARAVPFAQLRVIYVKRARSPEVDHHSQRRVLWATQWPGGFHAVMDCQIHNVFCLKSHRPVPHSVDVLRQRFGNAMAALTRLSDQKMSRTRSQSVRKVRISAGALKSD